MLTWTRVARAARDPRRGISLDGWDGRRRRRQRDSQGPWRALILLGHGPSLFLSSRISTSSSPLTCPPPRVDFFVFRRHPLSLSLPLLLLSSPSPSLSFSPPDAKATEVFFSLRLYWVSAVPPSPVASFLPLLSFPATRSPPFFHEVFLWISFSTDPRSIHPFVSFGLDSSDPLLFFFLSLSFFLSFRFFFPHHHPAVSTSLFEGAPGILAREMGGSVYCRWGGDSEAATCQLERSQ